MSLDSDKKKARIIDTLLLVGIIVGGLWFVVTSGDDRMSSLVGQPAPPFKLRTVGGEVVGPPTYEGKVVLLDFWATWCDPCLRQMPAIDKVSHEHPELVVLPVNVDDDGPRRQRAIERFLDEARIEVDTLLDDGAVQAMYGVDTIPALVVIDRTGAVSYASSGVHTFQELNKRVVKAMEAK